MKKMILSVVVMGLLINVASCENLNNTELLKNKHLNKSEITFKPIFDDKEVLKKDNAMTNDQLKIYIDIKLKQRDGIKLTSDEILFLDLHK